MKELYKAPELSLEELNAEDVVRTSGVDVANILGDDNQVKGFSFFN